MLRDYINATAGFAKLGAVTRRSPKSLMRMFGPSGNPQARNLLEVAGYLQRKERVCFEVRAIRPARGKLTVKAACRKIFR
ncbi:MAG: hypothetical protein ACREQI_07385 [Candidatus Binataceae bacterium]